MVEPTTEAITTPSSTRFTDDYLSAPHDGASRANTLLVWRYLLYCRLVLSIPELRLILTASSIGHTFVALRTLWWTHPKSFMHQLAPLHSAKTSASVYGTLWCARLLWPSSEMLIVYIYTFITLDDDVVSHSRNVKNFFVLSVAWEILTRGIHEH